MLLAKFVFFERLDLSAQFELGARRKVLQIVFQVICRRQRLPDIPGFVAVRSGDMSVRRINDFQVIFHPGHILHGRRGLSCRDSLFLRGDVTVQNDHVAAGTDLDLEIAELGLPQGSRNRVRPFLIGCCIPRKLRVFDAELALDCRTYAEDTSFFVVPRSGVW